VSKRSLLKLALVLAVALTVAGVAFGWFSSTGSGTASGSVGGFDAAVITAPSSSSGSPTITFTQDASVPSDTADDGEITYTVERKPHSSGSYAALGSGTCSGSLPHGTASCADSSAAPSGTYDYRVVANFRSWTATSNVAGPVHIAPDAPTLVAVANGNGFINDATKNGVSVDVTVPNTSASTDTVTVTLSDSGDAHTVTGTASSVDGGGIVHVTGIDASSLNDGNTSVSAISSNGGADSSSASTTATKDTVAPNAPTSVSVVNGGGFVNDATKSSVSIDVAVPAGSLASDTVSLSVSDGSHAPVTASQAATSGAGTVHFTGVDLSGLDDGSLSLSATSADAAGNPSSAASGSATKDTVAPNAPTSVAVVSGGGFINDATKTNVSVNVVVPASSSSSDTVSVTLSDGTHSVSASAPGVTGGGTVHLTAIDASGLDDGTIDLSSNSTDAPGNTSSSTSGSATKDTVAPNAPSSVSVVSGGGFVNDATKSSVSVDVVVPAGSLASDTVSLSVSDGTNPAVTATQAATSGAGTVHFTGIDLSGLADGSLSLSATATDQAGNPSSAATGSATKDTVAPDAPSSVSVVSGGGFVNNATKSSVSLDVVVPAGSLASDTVSLSVSDGSHAPVTATLPATSGAGTVHFTGVDLSGLDDGSLSLSATSTDAAGNPSSAASGSATKDTVAPNAPSSVSVVSGGGYVNDATKSSVSLDVVVPAGSLASDTVSLSVSDGTNPAVTATQAATSGAGTVHFTGIDLSGLADGSLSLSATATDAAGNPSSAATGSATKDTVAPDAPTAASVVSGGGFINNATKSSVNVDVTVPATGLFTDTITVTLDDGNGHTASGTAASATGGGTIHVLGINASSLDDGSVSISATATDQAGNPSSAASGSATKDTVAPAAPTSVAVVNGGGFINNATKSSVSVDVVVPASSSASNTLTVTLTDPGNAHTVTATSASITGGGTVHLTGINASTLNDGTISLSVTSTDPAGNPSSATTGSATKDTAAPSAPSVTSTNPTSPSKTSTTPTIIGSAESGSNVKLYTNGTCTSAVAGTGSESTFVSPGIGVTVTANTTTTFFATATDAAGNISACSSTSVSYTHDNTAPSVGAAVVAATSGGDPIGSAGFVSGLAASARTYRVYANISDLSGVASATADVSLIETSQTAVPLVFNATGVTFGATTYHWISAERTATPGQTTGAKTFTITATDVAGNAPATSGTFPVTVDSTIPAATMTDPGSPLTGTVALGSTATDAGAGIASMTIQRSPNGANTWTSICTDSTSPYGCSFNTASVLDGAYDFRATAIDNAGNVDTSGARNNRQIDNNAPTISLSANASPLSATQTITATVGDGTGSGVSSVTIQRSPAGANTWTDICTDTTSPFSCPFDTTTVTDGSYDFRGTATDGVNLSTTSATITRTVDNPPRAEDVQTTNSGTANLPNAGDIITYTYNEPIAPGTFLTGWDGSSKTVEIRLYNNGAGGDFVQIWDGANQANLGVHLLKGDFVTGGSNNASYIAFSSSSIQRVGSTVVATLGGTPTAGGTPGAVLAPAGVGAKNMTWGASASVQDTTGNPAATTVITESGTSDADF
jgi:hypothetical protein